ncbi:MAG: oligosaccharide flippase family protein [bacterium]
MNSKKVINSSAIQILSFIIGTVVTFFLMPFVIHRLGDYSYGLWVLINTITSYFAFSEFGMSSGVQHYLSIWLGKNDPDSCKRIFSNSLFLYFLISIINLVLVGISLVVILLLKERLSESYLVAVVMAILGLNLSISFIFHPYTSALAAHIRFDITAWIGILRTLLNAALTVIVLRKGFGLIMLALISLLVGLLSNILTLIMASRTNSNLKFDRKEVNKKDLKSLFKYSGKTFLAQLADILRFRVDEVVTGSFISVSMVTNYSIAQKLVQLPNSLFSRLIGILNPLFTQYVGRQDLKKLDKSFLFSFKIAAIIASFIYACSLILGKTFISLWVGPNYQNAFIPLVILGGAHFIGMAQSPCIEIFYATNKHQYFAYQSIFEGVVNLGLSILFVTKFGMGINGVALGTLIPILFTKLFIQPFLITSLIDLKVKDFYFLLLYIVTSGGMTYGLFYLLYRNFNINSYLYLLFNLILLLCLFLAHAAVVLEGDERELVMQYVRQYVNRAALARQA